MPDAESISKFNFDFWTPPLYSLILSLNDVIANPPVLYFLFKFTNLVLWCFLFRESLRFFRKLEISPKRINFIMLTLSCLSWPLLLSASILPDMLFALLFLILANQTLNFDGSSKHIFKVALTFLLLLATKPMSLIVAPSFVLFFFFANKNRKNLPTNLSILNSHILKFLISLLVGFSLFSPWLIKNKIKTGNFYETVQEEEYKSSLDFIDSKKFVPQLEKSFAYFWEYPSLDRINDIESSFENTMLKTLARIYFYFNLIIFAIVTILIAFSIVKKAFIERRRKSLGIFSLIIFCLAFSTFYWPFFSKYNYWDTGRYSFPVLIFLVFFLSYFTKIKNKKFRYSFYFVTTVALLFSVINSFVIVYIYKKKEDEVLEVKELVDQYPEIKTVITNDPFTRDSLGYFLDEEQVVLDDKQLENCEVKKQVESYELCLGSTQQTISLFKVEDLSRLTR